MKVLVDTSVWSLVLRRKKRPEEEYLTSALNSLVEHGRIAMIGPIRQELLSGLKERAHFDRLRDHLRAFPDVEIAVEDYEEAALSSNCCRARGIQGSNTDFLICAIAVRRDLSIFTTDGDFIHFAKVLPIALHEPSR